MKSTIAIAALVAGANALVGRSDSCCFELTASGGASGTLGQLSDGQVRVGDDSLSAAEFCLSNSIITDSEGRGCIITSEATQFQCDEGATGTSGFSLTSSGLLKFDGSSAFIACETGENDGRNVYTTNSTSVSQCVSIELTSDSCAAAAASSAVTSSVAAVSTPPPIASPTSYPVIPTSPARSASPVTSTPVASTASSSASSAASSVAAYSGAGISAPDMSLARWAASFVAMASLMVAF
ncbi:hypothetical protein N7462_003298 [Penicillium macrosclerotiorum]|uniref:uncharacterized protein n=1 Tax=Penicillium macrosclerotiorum TaxID=303699 RepID=UPI0025466863|nr:uncharacterized protein N7462_003298 [Penicillium macrosclerotiorum]KAJ5688906.1 hypothetical protein N7462_003298 [Penicillium macrosclerotiorum]